MPVAAYFDESIREDGDAPICVGGFIFKASDYRRFSERWRREVLRLPDRRTLRHFHTTDLFAGRGVYAGVTIDQRVQILRNAVTVICDLFYLGVGISFMQAEFERLAPPEWPKFRGSIYSACCHMCLQATAHWLRRNQCHLDVLYVFERGHKMQNEADTILKAIAADAEARKDWRYRQHKFEDKDKEAGLQAADLYAWLVTKTYAMKGKTLPRSVVPFREQILRLAKNIGERGRIHEFTGDKLRRFLIEQGDPPAGKYVDVESFGPHVPKFR